MQEELDNAIATIRLMVDIAKVNHAENRRLKVVISNSASNALYCVHADCIISLQFVKHFYFLCVIIYYKEICTDS